jgi:hypothetical protein
MRTPYFTRAILLQKSADKIVKIKLHHHFLLPGYAEEKRRMAMRSIALMLLSLFLSGCQINPYTFQPDWTSPSWFDAGKEDAMNGLPVKDNQTLADSFNDPQVDRSEYLRGYADGQKKVCEEGFIYAWGVAGKSFPASCDTVENAAKLHESWQQGMDESMRSSRLN